MSKTILKIRTTSTNLRIDEYDLWIKDMVRWQKNNFNINIVLTDLHSLLQLNQGKKIEDCSNNIVKELFALGLNSSKINIVKQSCFPEIQELAMILQYVCSLNSKSTNNTLCDKKINEDEYFISMVNLFSEIAMVMIFNADIVLIEEKNDIKKIELIRDFISKINLNFKTNFKMPQSFLANHSKLIGLNGEKEPNDANSLLFSDSRDNIRKKILAAKTDSDSIVKFDIKKKPQISNLIDLYRVLTGGTYDEIEDKFCKKNYGVFKSDIMKQLEKFLQRNFKNLAKEKEIKKLFLISIKGTSYKLIKNMKNIKKNIGIHA